MKVAILGDIHQDTRYLDEALYLAKSSGAEMMIQVGDFGFDFRDSFIQSLISVTNRHKIPLYAIRGNHDDPHWFSQIMQFGNVHLIPDGMTITIGSKEVAFIGGAVSIDRRFREENITWWKNERVNPSVVKAWSYTDQQADVLISHESPIVPSSLGEPPMRITPDVELDCNEDRMWVSAAVEVLEVSEVYHGHYHHYSSEEHMIGDKKTLVTGLASNYESLDESMIIVDF